MTAPAPVQKQRSLMVSVLWLVAAVLGLAIGVQSQRNWPLEMAGALATLLCPLGLAVLASRLAPEGARVPWGFAGGLAGLVFALLGLGLPDSDWRMASMGSGTESPRDSIEIPTDPTQVDSTTYQQLLAYAQDTTLLTFDSVTHRAADERYLTIIDTVTVDTTVARGRLAFRRLASPRIRKLVGPRAKIVPEKWAFRNSQADLGTGPGRGRIVARVWVDSLYTAPDGRPRPSGGYPFLQLPPGVSYLWVDHLEINADDSTGVARLVIIPANRAYGLRVDTLVYRFSRGGWQRSSQARWVFDMSTDPDSWNLTCPMGCCE